MKNMILTMALVLSAFTTAQAQQVCGHLTKEMRSPECNPGGPCSHMVSEQYVLTNESEKIDLGAPSMQIFNEFAQDEGKDVCVDGTISRSSGEMMVHSIRLAVSLN